MRAASFSSSFASALAANPIAVASAATFVTFPRKRGPIRFCRRTIGRRLIRLHCQCGWS